MHLSIVSLSPLCVLFTIKKKWPIVLQWNFLCSHGCLWFPDYGICLSSLSVRKIFRPRNVFGYVSLSLCFFLFSFTHMCTHHALSSNIRDEIQCFEKKRNEGHFCFSESCLGHVYTVKALWVWVLLFYAK